MTKGKDRRVIRLMEYKLSEKKCLEATQLEMKINHLAKKEVDVYSFKERHIWFIKNNTLLSKHS